MLKVWFKLVEVVTHSLLKVKIEESTTLDLRLLTRAVLVLQSDVR